MKKLMGLWIFVVVILISGLTYVGYLIKNENKVYKVLENKLEEVAQGYFGENPGLLSNNKIVQDTELGSYKEEILTKLKENDCKGYVNTTSNLGIYEYKAYIKCNNYETKGYEKQTNTCTEGC